MVNDIFSNDIFNSKIQPPTSKTYNLIGTHLPTNQDLFFVSKWHEIFDRYCSARIFIREAYKDKWSDWEHWFNLSDDENDEAFKIILMAEMYETALINYNILVDLSWTITYTSCEYVLYRFDSDGNVTNAEEVRGLVPIDEAGDILRKLENNTTTPTADNNPFTYLKSAAPEFSSSVDIIVEFWKNFSGSNIRSLYNYIKHKGKPQYKELKDLSPGRFFSLQIGNKSYPSDISDVQRIISLKDGLEELVKFDNEELFPYLEKLIIELEKAVNPSPMLL